MTEEKQATDIGTDDKQISPESRPLSTKHLKFCDAIAAGCSQAEAYRRVFRPAKRRTIQDITTAAWRIASNPLVKARISELLGKSEIKTLLTINQRLGILAGIAQGRMSKAADRIRSVEVYSKIAGDQAPERLEITNPAGQTFNVGVRQMTRREKVRAALVELRKS